MVFWIATLIVDFPLAYISTRYKDVKVVLTLGFLGFLGACSKFRFSFCDCVLIRLFLALSHVRQCHSVG